MRHFRNLLLILFAFANTLNGQSEIDRLRDAMTFFESEYDGLNVPAPALSYTTFLGNLGSVDRLTRQRQFFQELKRRMDDITPTALPEHLLLEYGMLRYEANINLDRIGLSIRFRRANTDVASHGIYHVNYGKEWYEYLVKAWTSSDLTPNEVEDYGRSEVKRILFEMKRLEERTTGFLDVLKSNRFLTNDIKKIESEIENVRRLVNKRLNNTFPDFNDLPSIRVTQGTNRALAQAPAYYANNTFYYNLFDKPFDLRQVDWLFIHEGNPGHHFQINYESEVSVPNYRRSLSYSGFREGWAAYIEDLGDELGVYQTPFHKYSKWEWDLIRSVRLILDVGINHKGWSNEEALAEWRKHINDLDDIGLREINRMRNWPAQVLTYKIGSMEIKRLRDMQSDLLSSDFDYKRFHTQLLSQRSIPVVLIKNLFSTK